MAKSSQPKIKKNGSSPSFFSMLSPFKQSKKVIEENKFKFELEVIKLKQENNKKNKSIIRKKKELHEVALKEIAYYLTLLKIPDHKSLQILVKLFKEFEVKDQLVHKIFFTHRQYTEAIIANKVQSAVDRNQDREAYSKHTGLSFVFLRMLEFLDGDSCYFELLRLNKEIRNDIRIELYGRYLMRNPGITKEIRLNIHLLMEIEVVDTDKIEILKENRDIIKLDLRRTCQDKHLKSRVELVLYNFLKKHEETIGYFQGLNFIVFFLIQNYKSDQDALAIVSFLADQLFMKYFQLNMLKTGHRILSLFHAAERLIEINLPSLYAILQREGLTCQQFAAPNLLTLFTVHQYIGGNFELVLRFWDFIMHRGWQGMFVIFVYLMISMQDFIKECEMEDIIFFWDSFFKGKEFWNNEVYDKKRVSHLISETKLKKLDAKMVHEKLNSIHENFGIVKVSDEVIELFYDEFVAINQSIKKVQDRLTDVD